MRSTSLPPSLSPFPLPPSRLSSLPSLLYPPPSSITVLPPSLSLLTPPYRPFPLLCFLPLFTSPSPSYCFSLYYPASFLSFSSPDASFPSSLLVLFSSFLILILPLFLVPSFLRLYSCFYLLLPISDLTFVSLTPGFTVPYSLLHLSSALLPFLLLPPHSRIYPHRSCPLPPPPPTNLLLPFPLPILPPTLSPVMAPPLPLPSLPPCLPPPALLS